MFFVQVFAFVEPAENLTATCSTDRYLSQKHSRKSEMLFSHSVTFPGANVFFISLIRVTTLVFDFILSNGRCYAVMGVYLAV